MTNHPNRSRTYWYNSPRGFANEYTVGVATTKQHAEQYKAQGWDRIDRDRALREMTYGGDAATQSYASVEIDGDAHFNARDVARCIRTGGDLAKIPHSY